MWTQSHILYFLQVYFSAYNIASYDVDWIYSVYLKLYFVSDTFMGRNCLHTRSKEFELDTLPSLFQKPSQITTSRNFANGRVVIKFGLSY